MYAVKFSKYNNVLNQIMSEEDTLEDIIDIQLDGKPSKEEKKHLCDGKTWSKYAFANDKPFYMTVYKGNNIVACISYCYFGITIDFLSYQADKMVVYLTLDYNRCDINFLFNEDRVVKYPNGDLFLSKIISYSFEEQKNTETEIFFKNTGLALITVTEKYFQEMDWNTQKQEVKVNISHNFIRCPIDYMDFEYLLDYQNNIKEEYFNFPNKKNNKM